MHSHPEHKGILEAHKLIQWKKKQGLLKVPVTPSRVIISAQMATLRKYKSRFFQKQIHGLAGTHLCIDASSGLYLSGGWGIGAPALIATCEELHALGATEFYLVGVCGRLSADIAEGAIRMASSVIREEGTSAHYLSPTFPKEIHCNPATNLDGLFSTAKFVSTDAPYRETMSKYKEWQSCGAELVDMESSALYAFAHHYNIYAASIGIGADSLAGGKWVMMTNPLSVTKKQSEAINQLIQTLKR